MGLYNLSDLGQLSLSHSLTWSMHLCVGSQK